MLTEKGTIKVSTKLDEKMQKEFSSSLFNCGLVFLIVGAVGLVLGIVLDTLSEYFELAIKSFDFLYVFSAFLLVFGIFFVVYVKQIIKKAANLNKVLTYEFFSNYIMINQTYNGEVVLTGKIYNHQITRTKETKNYLFLLSDSGAYPISKSELKEEECNTIKGIFNNTAAIAPIPEVPPQSEVKEEVEQKEDPFDEFKNQD